MHGSSDHLRRIACAGAHMLGSIGVVLALGALLAALAPDTILAWLPWEASFADRLSSMACGVALMAGGGHILQRANELLGEFDED